MIDYIGLDIHKKTISYCVKQGDGKILDEGTGSQWNILGRAISGPLEGTQLPAVVHANHFWFAWQAFNPETAVRFPIDFQG